MLSDDFVKKYCLRCSRSKLKKIEIKKFEINNNSSFFNLISLEILNWVQFVFELVPRYFKKMTYFLK